MTDVASAVANATLQIRAGTSSGSGFHFSDPTIVITNHHVIAGQTDPIHGITETGDLLTLERTAESRSDTTDFAVLRVDGEAPPGRLPLSPEPEAGLPERGTEVLFAGYPHGIEDLLVQRAIVSGPVGQHGFYVDGSVNGGNSGGPVVDATTGLLIGLVTQRRFLGGADLEQMAAVASQLVAHCEQLAHSGGQVAIMGIDFGQFAAMSAQANLLLRQVIEANANAGLGIAFSHRPVVDRLKELALLQQPV